MKLHKSVLVIIFTAASDNLTGIWGYLSPGKLLKRRMYEHDRNNVGAEFGCKKRRVVVSAETCTEVKDFVGQTYITSNTKLDKLTQKQWVN